MLTHLFRHASDTIRHAAGSPIFEEGEEGRLAFVVVDGEVELIFRGRVLETLGPGSIFGEMALIDHAPRSATARAKTDCALAPIDARRFEFLVQQTPNFATTVMRTMAERLRRMTVA